MPLADDVTGDGYLDVVVGTMNGQVLVLETSIPYHPMNSWSSFPKHRMNGFTHGVIGLSVPLSEKRILSQVSKVKSGSTVAVSFDIWDARKKKVPGRKFVVTISKGTNRAVPLAKAVYSSPGRYTLEVPVEPPDAMLLVIGMTNEHGQYFEDSVYVAISTRFYVWIKYLVAAPVAILCLPLLLMQSRTYP